ILLILNIISIFTGIVFSLDPATKEMVRAGFMGYLPYVVVGLYSAALLFILIYQSEKKATEIIPILFLGFAFLSGLVFPFLFGKDYSKIFCSSIAIGLFVYYVFLILQLTKKDALTGLLNRQAYYSMVDIRGKEITAVLSVDMNGLKAINDRGGHLAGDQALIEVAKGLKKSVKGKQEIFRIGGDEFVFLCLKTNKNELEWVAASIKENLASTPYSCSIGYCLKEDGMSIEEMVKKSDEMMYADKATHYHRRSGDPR
ncbi:MAG: GGDEF domain-containing protein, partial [Bacilli bacterium]|nr:GGDEF domain-containing protein [Bacilli bacterium]